MDRWTDVRTDGRTDILDTLVGRLGVDLKTGQVTLTTPTRGHSIILKLAFDILYLRTKFGSFSHSGDIIAGVKSD